MPFNAPPLCPLQVEARERIGGRSHREQLTPPAVNEPLWIDEGEGVSGYCSREGGRPRPGHQRNFQQSLNGLTGVGFTSPFPHLVHTYTGSAPPRPSSSHFSPSPRRRHVGWPHPDTLPCPPRGVQPAAVHLVPRYRQDRSDVQEPDEP